MEERLRGGSTRGSDRWVAVTMRVSGDRGKQVRKGVGGAKGDGDGEGGRSVLLSDRDGSY